MLKDYAQISLSLSPYHDLYDIIIPKDHLLRKIKDNIDFSFVNPMLRKQYCEHFGRPAKEPEMMFKLLFLKKLYDLSDERLISNAKTDMAYKYFLDLEPEDDIIDSSLLTKFRKTRITEDILEEMLKETIHQAIEKQLIKSTAIIVDSTHTNAAVHPKTATQVLRELSKQLRREIYTNMYEVSSKFPDKPEETADLEKEIEYTQELIENIETDVLQSDNPKIIRLCERIKELLKTERIREIRSQNDEDARFGHKTPTSTFFGYKNHIAMTEERLITGIEVTSGEDNDGKHLIELVRQSKHEGIEVKEVIGDMAYCGQQNIEFCKNNDILLISKTNPVVANSYETKSDNFLYNKDAKTMQCPAGALAMRVSKKELKSGNTGLNYYFSKRKCAKCPMALKCKVGCSKTKTYHLTIVNEKTKARINFEKSEYFQSRENIRYKIEEKNNELKNVHGLSRADSVGLKAMRLQTYFTAFVVNIKRIVKLIGINTPISFLFMKNIKFIIIILEYLCMKKTPDL